MIAMLEMSDKTNGRGAGDLIFRKLSYRMGGSRKKMIKGESFVAIGRKMVIGLPVAHFHFHNQMVLY